MADLASSVPKLTSSSIIVDLPHGRGYPIHFSAFSKVPLLFEAAAMRRGQALLVTDENVAEHYLQPLQDIFEDDGWSPRSHIIPAGEASKSPEVLGRLYDWALGKPIDRQTPVIALGGGVVGDLAGYLAATLLRGLPLAHVPTSLIAQADSSIGGKAGINHPTGKNLVGAFHQPRLVLTDTSTLSTLPARDYTSGLAEVVKHALIADADYFDWLENRWEDILTKEPQVLTEMVCRAAAIKAAIVAEDERENDRRKLLNFGHTFGHAIELATGYGTFTHGEAVALGMRTALHLSNSMKSDGVFQKDALLPAFDRADALLARIPITGTLEGLAVETLLNAMQADKKRAGKQLQIVLLHTIGGAFLTDTITLEAVRASWTNLLSISRD